jgi:hypothetical protein
MSIGLSSASSPIEGGKQTVLRRVSCSFEPDGSIKFEGTICHRITIDGDVVDTNFQTVGATYPSEDAMLALAANNWAPPQEQLEAMGNAVSGSVLGAVTVILQGFVGISNAAVDVLLNPPPPAQQPPQP